MRPFNLYQPRPFFLSAGPAVASFLDSSPKPANATVYTHSSVTLGAAAADREIVVMTAARGATSATVSSLTVGGVSATQVVEQTALQATVQNGVAIYIASVPSGTTGDIVVTYANSMLRSGIGFWRVTGLSSSTAHDTATDTTLTSGDLSATINIPAGGALFAGNFSGNGAASTSTWTGVTENYDEVLETTFSHSGGFESGLAVETGRTVESALTGTPSSHILVAASLS